MSTYLLLRDNKQSGPYTVDEIKAIGFKKYDLVWVEGRSAAWRYPGEIDEFKSLAPVVEEQPYDRFFKKPSEAKKQTQTSSPKAEASVRTPSNKKMLAEVSSAKVFADKPIKKNKPTAVQQKPFSEQIKSEPVKHVPAATVLAPISKPPVEPSLDYPNTVETIATSSYKNNNGRNAKLGYLQYIQPAALVLVVLALLGAGIFIGLSINKNKTVPSSANQTESSANDIANKAAAPNYLIPVSSSLTNSEKPVPENDGTNLGNATNAGAASHIQEDPSKPIQKKTANDHKKDIFFKQNSDPITAKAINGNDQIKDSDASYLSVAHRESTHRSDISTEDKDALKKNIANLVSVSSNKFNVGTFGGISDLQLTVNNKTNYPLDVVMVEVQYIQANKKVFKTENVYFHNIRAGSSVMVEAPKSSRGVKVEYKVKLINSKEPSVSFSGI
ncbi:MAG: hypothetical protein JST58_02765 [Bacteroidetes bacterium]|nr:hypothetical protein [Bacteroidota bacterium]